jgi:NADH-quinone oxidoreductase subunit C
MIPETLHDNPLAMAFDSVAVTAKFAFAELTIEVDPANILAALRIAKNDLKFERLSTVTGVDRYPAEPRFEIVYHLQSLANRQWVRFKVRLSGDNPEIESAFAVYRSANWYEREVFDLFGVRFLNHPDMTRIMMPADWVGYPLRKDYPVTGMRY